MQKVTVVVDREKIDRWVCSRGHPHPTQSGAEDCEEARAEGANDSTLYAMFDAEVAEFNAS